MHKHASGLRSYNTIVFDAGNTLIEQVPTSAKVVESFFNRTMGHDIDETGASKFLWESEVWAGKQGEREAHGAPRLPNNVFIREMYAAGFMGVLSQEDNSNLLGYAEQIGRLFQNRKWQPMAGAQQVLTTLKNSGYTLAMVSNFAKELPNMLEEFFLAPFFEIVIVSEIVEIWKPDPAIMQLAMEKLSKLPDDCIYVGDHPYDVQCAKSAGMGAIWLNVEKTNLPKEVTHKPDCEIYSLDQLVGLFQVAGNQ